MRMNMIVLNAIAFDFDCVRSVCLRVCLTTFTRPLIATLYIIKITYICVHITNDASECHHHLGCQGMEYCLWSADLCLLTPS